MFKYAKFGTSFVTRGGTMAILQCVKKDKPTLFTEGFSFDVDAKTGRIDKEQKCSLDIVEQYE